MKIATARHFSNIPEGAAIYGKFTQPFGAGVDRVEAWDRLATIIDLNGPSGYVGAFADDLAADLLMGLDFPNDGCEVTFYLYSTED